MSIEIVHVHFIVYIFSMHFKLYIIFYLSWLGRFPRYIVGYFSVNPISGGLVIPIK